MKVVRFLASWPQLATAVCILISISGCSSSSDSETQPDTPTDAVRTAAKPKGKLFQEVRNTGIGFVNPIKEDGSLNFFRYQYLYNGGGVAIGDVNQDGMDDVYFTGNFVPDRLYLNQGDMKFRDVSEEAGIDQAVGWKTGVTMADVNDDGMLDIYVCRSGWFKEPNERRNLLYINQGEGKFAEKAGEYGLDDGGHSVIGGFFDYDKDGDLDMYLTNHPIAFKQKLGERLENMKNPADEVRDKLFRNDGGKFTEVSRAAGIVNYGHGLGLSLVDLDGDGWQDIYVANDFQSPDFFYHNNGDGTFTEQMDEAFRHMSYFSMGCDAGDINNDGHPDLMVVEMLAEDNRRQKTNMASMNPELFWALVDMGFRYQFMRNVLQLNNGNGTFSEIAYYADVATTDWSWGPLFGDFDLDGDQDLIVTNGYLHDTQDKDFVKSSNKLAAQHNNQLSFDQVQTILPSTRLQNYAFENKGGLKFEKVSMDWGFNFAGYSNGVAYGDLDNDGDLDVIVNKPITIDILSDDVAEGFERFRVEITDVDNDAYLITNGQSTQFGAINGEATVTVADANVSIATFQQNVNGYAGTQDGYIDGEAIFTKFGQDPVIRVDQVKGEGEDVATVVRPQQGLLKFEDIFGNAANQVPAGSQIFGGFLTVNVQNNASGADVRFFRMLQDWDEVQMSWVDPQGDEGNSITNGIRPDDIESVAEPDAVVPDPGRAGLVEIPLNVDTLQAWSNGSLDNFGWSIINDSGSLWGINSSEAFLVGTFAPELTLLYTEPTASTGVFSLSTDEVIANEVDATATVTINRVGGSDGAATVDWSIGAGTGDLSDISGATSGSVSFADGELSKTFTVNVNDDTELESNETLTVSISGDGLDFARSETTLLIRDNDFSPFAGELLLNEIWINSPGNDPPHEFVELKGVPELSMGSLYYVAIEGLVGDREGSAEKVVDLGEFANGTAAADGNGYTVITPDADGFAFNVPAGTTQIDDLGSIGQENVASQNDSTTYMLIYSPLTRMATTEFDYDWDNDGALDLPLGAQIVDSIGVRVLGAEDQLYGPSTNQASFDVSDPDVDAISRDRNGTQINRGSEWFGGDLFPAGDDYLLYETAEAFGLPVEGAALTPGEPNVGTLAESPVVQLVDVVENGDGTVAVNFTGPVTQLLIGDGSSVSPGGTGITITDTDGNVLPTVDVVPAVSGFGTPTLTLTFTGTGVVGGQLPSGMYDINIVGNGLVGNGRAVDADGDGTALDSFASQTINVDGGLAGDFDGNGTYDCADINALTGEIAAGTGSAAFDLTGDGLVDLADRDQWLTIAGAANNASGGAYLLGDASLDGVVDTSDFNIWNSNKFTNVAEWCSGDFNADGVVDTSDFNIWNQNKFQSSDAVLLTTPDVAQGDSNSASNEITIDFASESNETIQAEQVAAPFAGPAESTGRSSAVAGAEEFGEDTEPALIDKIFANLEW